MKFVQRFDNRIIIWNANTGELESILNENNEYHKHN